MRRNSKLPHHTETLLVSLCTMGTWTTPLDFYDRSLVHSQLFAQYRDGLINADVP